MTKAELRSLIARLLPHLKTAKELLALFTLALILALGSVNFGSLHKHVEAENDAPINVTVPWSASGNTSSYLSTFSRWPGK